MYSRGSLTDKSELSLLSDKSENILVLIALKTCGLIADLEDNGSGTALVMSLPNVRRERVSAGLNTSIEATCPEDLVILDILSTGKLQIKASKGVDGVTWPLTL